MNATLKNKNEIIKAIERGDFRDFYLVYDRKSTDEPNNQKNSIEYQKAENQKFSEREQLPIAPITISGFCVDGVISERHSGFKESDDLNITDDGVVQYGIDRPKFMQLLQYMSKGYFKGIICLCWDRISRNQGDDTIVRKLMRRGVDIRFVYAQYDNSSAGALHMDIDSMFAQHHSRVTSEKITLTIKNLRDKGKCTYRVPIGYLNPGSTDDKPHDPERAAFITEAYKLYDTGYWSLSDIARHAQKKGITTSPRRRRRTRDELLSENPPEIEAVTRPINKNHISRILANPFYKGIIKKDDGTYINSKCHKPLVSDALFERVQARLKKQYVSTHYTEKLDHPFRGMIRCAICKRVYTPYEQKGILYFSSRCLNDCSNTKKNFNLDFVTSRIGSYISKLHFTDDELADFEARVSTDVSLLEERRNNQLKAAEQRKKRVRADLAYLRTEQLSLLKTGAYTAENLVEERQKLEQELDQINEAEQISETAIRETMKEVVKFSELLKNVASVYYFADYREKERIIKILFSELFLDENTLKYIPQIGFEVIFRHYGAMGGPLDWLSELQPHRAQIRTAITALERINTRN